jgi:hypothetical protein
VHRLPRTLHAIRIFSLRVALPASRLHSLLPCGLDHVREASHCQFCRRLCALLTHLTPLCSTRIVYAQNVVCVDLEVGDQPLFCFTCKPVDYIAFAVPSVPSTLFTPMLPRCAWVSTFGPKKPLWAHRLPGSETWPTPIPSPALVTSGCLCFGRFT